MPTAVPIDEPQPSQPFVDADRLGDVLEWFDLDARTYDPVPTVGIAGETVITDGHTRAFVAYLSGADTLAVVHDPDREALNLELYRECVGWCRDESVTGIADLVGRVVSRETFLDEWVARCRSSPLYERD